jgi:hypothetical protein
MPRRDIPHTLFETIGQAIGGLLETPALPRVMMWVGGAALIVSWVLLAYLVGALLARIVVVWSF